jgi:TatD DNase family protein
LAFPLKKESANLENFSVQANIFFCFMFLDHHTHISGIPSNEPEIMRIFSIDASNSDDLCKIPVITSMGHKCSIGLHPMSFNAMSFELVSSIVDQYRDNIIGIGECGLDTRIDIPKGKQIELFTAHAERAKELHLPLIIHCVRSHDEIIALHKQIRPSNPWIMHGFNRTERIALQLLDQGILLSIGKELLDGRHPLSTFFKKIAEYPFFLETDGKDIAIQSLYQQASILLEMSIEAISTNIASHVQQVYGRIKSNSTTLE